MYPHLLTRAQCELLISLRSTQYPSMGLPLSFGSFQVTSMLLAVISLISGLSGASGGSKKKKKERKIMFWIYCFSAFAEKAATLIFF